MQLFNRNNSAGFVVFELVGTMNRPQSSLSLVSDYVNFDEKIEKQLK